MSEQPTLLEDMTDAEQKEILFAWWHDKPLQWWGGKRWIDRSLGLLALREDRAYRIKPEPRAEAEPTLFKDMTDAEQKEILLAWFHGRPVQWWNGEWIDCNVDDYPIQESMAYRLKPEQPRSGVAYVNVYPGPMMFDYKSKADADRASSRDRIARVRVEWTEGQLDD